MQQIERLIEEKKAVAIMGVTASGKSGLSLEIAKKIPVEIISVDSAAIYKGMDIGTAKPTSNEIKNIPHHLLDIIYPSEIYSVANFIDDTHKLVEEIFSRGHLPLLVGGTMMYFNFLQKGIAKLPSTNEGVRSKLLSDWNKNDEGLHKRLQKIDTLASERIHPNDKKRIIRALEVFEITGKSLSYNQKKYQSNGLIKFKLIKIALLPENRIDLHKKIEFRFKEMVEKGFIEEVKKLMEDKSIHSNLPSIKSIGYRQAWNYLENKIDYDTFIDKSVIATRQLAKAQTTWLRKEKDLLLLDPYLLTREDLVDQAYKYIISK